MQEQYRLTVKIGTQWYQHNDFKDVNALIQAVIALTENPTITAMRAENLKKEIPHGYEH